MPSWPAGLPQDLVLAGYSERPPATAIRFQPDAGPAIQRRRTTAGVRPIAVELALTKAEVETLDQFWLVTLANGSLEFDWVHPRTGAAATMRFVGDQPPDYQALDTLELWGTSLLLEIMP